MRWYRRCRHVVCVSRCDLWPAGFSCSFFVRCAPPRTSFQSKREEGGRGGRGADPIRLLKKKGEGGCQSLPQAHTFVRFCTMYQFRSIQFPYTNTSMSPSHSRRGYGVDKQRTQRIPYIYASFFNSSNNVSLQLPRGFASQRHISFFKEKLRARSSCGIENCYVR